MEIKNRTFDEERALYHLTDARVKDCRFVGPTDGESALKEAKRITVEDCRFELRYPFWHDDEFAVKDCIFTETSRAAMWYCNHGKVTDTVLNGIKCLRESHDILLEKVSGVSDEFGWKCSDISLKDCEFMSVYFMLETGNLTARNLKFKGKYSFQYVKNARIEDSVLDTKDAFWHSKNVTVCNSELNGEYLAWYSDGLTLINCKISGTQPFCYCRNLKLINCTMENTDLSFEYSDVEADVNGTILSVKNPKSGYISADGYGKIIRENAAYPCSCRIETKKTLDKD